MAKTVSRERQLRELRRLSLRLVVLKKRFLARVCLLICLLLQTMEGEHIERYHSCRRNIRNRGWWKLAWATYDESVS